MLRSLLEDRQGQGAEVKEKGVGAIPRSTYRETLFLKTVLSDGVIDVGKDEWRDWPLVHSIVETGQCAQ